MLSGNAYLVAGDAHAVSGVLALIARQGIETRGNPDVSIREYVHFGIDEARELRARAGARAIRGGRRVFIVECPGMNAEAQNALLKTLEEPPADAMFFFILPAPETLLPTLRSRAQTLVLSDNTTRESRVDAAVFLAAQPSERILMLKPFLERGEDDQRDIGAVMTFLGGLERALSVRVRGVSEMHGRDGLRAVYRARKYVTDKGALLKPLLEQVALLVPRRIR